MDVCAISNYSSVAAAVIKCGATVDLPNDDGLTPLALAVKHSSMETVTTLIQFGAQPNLRDPTTLCIPAHYGKLLFVADDCICLDLSAYRWILLSCVYVFVFQL